jgi:hypothetical protein
MNHRTLAWFAIGMLASAPALAKERGDHRHHGDYRSTTIEMLKHRDDALQRQATVIRVGAVEREQIAFQRARIDDLIDRLEAGRDVDRHELDRALGYPYHGDRDHGYPDYDYEYRHGDHHRG